MERVDSQNTFKFRTIKFTIQLHFAMLGKRYEINLNFKFLLDISHSD